MRPLPIADLRRSLLDWYDRDGRSLPWRIRPEDRRAGQQPDPYAIWLSEIMLQQTTVPHATPYWLAFLERWPTVHDLAQADDDEVMAAWAGLGYYSRARNLMACARVIAETGGHFPSDEKALLALPGIGPYTAAAIRAAAFDKPASVVDGNVERVISRLVTLKNPVRESKKEIKTIAASIADPDRPGDYAQAIMDLGATVCRPRSPSCLTCPWQFACEARKAGNPERYPVKPERKPKPIRRAVGFAVFHGEAIWLRKRPAKGLLGGMLEVPSTDWLETEWTERAVVSAAPFGEGWQTKAALTHVFTHFELQMQMWRHNAPADWAPPEGAFYPVEDMNRLALPSVMKKAIKAAL